MREGCAWTVWYSVEVWLGARERRPIEKREREEELKPEIFNFLLFLFF